MFGKVLVANRGEIAVRICATLQQLGVRAAVIYSDADDQALHPRCADEAYHLEGYSSAETYLNIERIVDVARQHGVEAIHPGYGFLSENAAFATACAEAGIIFIGPSPEVIRAMGDKIVAKRTVAAAGVPVLGGWSGDTTDRAALHREASAIGYPVLIKAAAGGGGKGMRIVHRPQELNGAVEAAGREAASAFADHRVFLEKYLPRPRHVEVQILGDGHGRVIHLFERECSIQRRHQKIVEEAPSAMGSESLRQQLGDAAVAAARAMGYTSAGTVEFLVGSDEQFYFLEVNTRLQVEHPVTEMVTMRDIVAAQVMVAAGLDLPFEQQVLQLNGHALECRIYAENPRRQYLPSIGCITHYEAPAGPGIRVDSGVTAGSEVTVHYDPMLAKLIAWGPTRQQAVQRMAWALRHFVILGVDTNIEMLQRVIDHPEFRAGRIHTEFLQDHDIVSGEEEPPTEALLAAALFARFKPTGSRSAEVLSGSGGVPGGGEVWQRAGRWRMFQR